MRRAGGSAPSQRPGSGPRLHASTSSKDSSRKTARMSSGLDCGVAKHASRTDDDNTQDAFDSSRILDDALRERLTTVDEDEVEYANRLVPDNNDSNEDKHLLKRLTDICSRMDVLKGVTEEDPKFLSLTSDLGDCMADMVDAFSIISGVDQGLLRDYAGKRLYAPDDCVQPRLFNIFKDFLLNTADACRMRRRWDQFFPPNDDTLAAKAHEHFEVFKQQFDGEDRYKAYLTNYHFAFPQNGDPPTTLDQSRNFEDIVKEIEEEAEYLKSVHNVESVTIAALERPDPNYTGETTAIVTPPGARPFFELHTHLTNDELRTAFGAHIRSRTSARQRLQQYGLDPISIAGEFESGAVVESANALQVPPGYWCSPTYVGEPGESQIVTLLIKIPDNFPPPNPTQHNYTDVCDGFVPANLAPYWADIFKGHWRKPVRAQEVQTADGVDILLQNNFMIAYTDWRGLFWPFESSRGRPAVGSKGSECYNASWLIRRTAKLCDAYQATPEEAKLLARFPASAATEGRVPSIRARIQQQVDRNETPASRPHIVAISAPIPPNTPGVPRVFWGTVRIHWSSAVTTGYPTWMLKNLTSLLPASVKTIPFESYVRAYDPLAPVKAVKSPLVPASLHDRHDSESEEEPLLPKVKEGTAKAMLAVKAKSSHRHVNEVAGTHIRKVAKSKPVIELSDLEDKPALPKTGDKRKADDGENDDHGSLPLKKRKGGDDTESESAPVEVTPLLPFKPVHNPHRDSIIQEDGEDEVDELDDDTPGASPGPVQEQKKDDVSFVLRGQQVTLPVHACWGDTVRLLQEAAAVLGRNRVPRAAAVDAVGNVFDQLEDPPDWLTILLTDVTVAVDTAAVNSKSSMS